MFSYVLLDAAVYVLHYASCGDLEFHVGHSL